MEPRTRALLTAALVLGVAAGPLTAPVTAHPRSPAAAGAASSGAAGAGGTRTAGPDTGALRSAMAGLPDRDVTAALVRVGGHGAWHGAAGVRDVATGAPALEHGRFRAGSVTKVVTAALVLQLATEGRVDLDAPVATYLPELSSPAFTRPVTVRHLLRFTSGLRAGVSLGDTVEEGGIRTGSRPSPRGRSWPRPSPGGRRSPRAPGRSTTTSTTRCSACWSRRSPATPTGARRPCGSSGRWACGTPPSPGAPTRGSTARTTAATTGSTAGSWTSPSGTCRTAGRRAT